MISAGRNGLVSSIVVERSAAKDIGEATRAPLAACESGWRFMEVPLVVEEGRNETRFELPFMVTAPRRSSSLDGYSTYRTTWDDYAMSLFFETHLIQDTVLAPHSPATHVWSWHTPHLLATSEVFHIT